MGKRYNIIDKITNGMQKPTVQIDTEHEFKINNSFPAAMAIKAYTEDKKLDEKQKIEKILGTALDKEANDYIKSLELPLSIYVTIVNVIMASLNDMDLEEIEKLAEEKKKMPSEQ